MPIRLTHATSLILRALASGRRHGFQIMQVSGLPSGTVYPALRRLEAGGHLESTWEGEASAHAEGRPRRRIYRLTSEGLALAARADERLAEARRLLADDFGLRPVGGGDGGA
ncbi:MAG: PadR family transcriptional regulator [Gemmatimonadetes bacterium]|nr:PadR family transcriptional regulator [Gemmatimonadota bacterium]NNF38451.1 PadR family transcriptional regulator [Gemmatimonadota bacterium]